jgi:hypothetical protein
MSNDSNRYTYKRGGLGDLGVKPQAPHTPILNVVLLTSLVTPNSNQTLNHIPDPYYTTLDDPIVGVFICRCESETQNA